MSDEEQTSPDWRKEAVLETLRKQARADQPPTAQVFLDESIDLDEESMAVLVKKMIESACLRAGQPASDRMIGKVRHLAKSFSVTADPEIIEELIKQPEVKSILPSEISDIYPKPVDSD